MCGRHARMTLSFDLKSSLCGLLSYCHATIALGYLRLAFARTAEVPPCPRHSSRARRSCTKLPAATSVRTRARVKIADQELVTLFNERVTSSAKLTDQAADPANR